MTHATASKIPMNRAVYRIAPAKPTSWMTRLTKKGKMTPPTVGSEHTSKHTCLAEWEC